MKVIYSVVAGGPLQPWAGVVCAFLTAWGVTTAGAATRLSNITGESEAYEYTRGLQAPDGMAIDPKSGDLYVAERKADRISVIKNGSRSTLIDKGFVVEKNLPPWAVVKAPEGKTESELVKIPRSREFLLDPQLHSPGSVSVAEDGTLYVAERREYGRVLKFTQDEGGKYTKAEVIAIPWIDKPFAWDDVMVAKDGRLFVVGYDEKGEVNLHFGTVLMRAVDGDWWIIDYGPFSRFSSLSLSRNHDILCVCERTKGELVTWDLVRQMPIGTIPRSVATGKAEAESNCLLKDGSFVVAEVPPEGQQGQSKLIHVDPMTSDTKGLAEGFKRIGSVIMDPKTGYVLVSDLDTGQIVEVRPDKALVSSDYLLQRSLEAFEASSGFTPRTTPVFLKNFLSRVGAAAAGTPSTSSGGGEPTPGEQVSEDVVYGHTFTLREFATKIPLVAGKVQTLLDDSVDVKNPVVSINFLLFFPSHVVRGTDLATPSMSFFLAERADGSREESKLLFSGLQSAERKAGGGWLSGSDNASIYVPLAACGMQQFKDHMDLSLSFLGMGVYDDYFLRLSTGKENVGSLVVESKDPDVKTAQYDLSFIEKPRVGGEPVKNLVVAGFDPAVKGQELGWLNIGSLPVGSSLAVSETDISMLASVDENLSKEIERKEREYRMTLGASATGGETAGDASADESGKAGDPGDEAQPAEEPGS